MTLTPAPTLTEPDQIKTSELKATLLKMDAGLTPEDIDETMLTFDQKRHAPRVDKKLIRRASI